MWGSCPVPSPRMRASSLGLARIVIELSTCPGIKSRVFPQPARGVRAIGLTELANELVDRLTRPPGDALAALAAERVLDHDEGEARDTEGAQLAHREPLE